MNSNTILPDDELLAERLQALAHPSRLALWRGLLAHGERGAPAGAIAEALGLAPNALTFHLDRLRHVGLISVRRDGRQRIYAASLPTMQGLLARLGETCCTALPQPCGAECPGGKRRRTRSTTKTNP
ncbi:MAG: ArsR/SmtB family transcription factor [Gammaproteobacteria bacterium]